MLWCMFIMWEMGAKVMVVNEHMCLVVVVEQDKERQSGLTTISYLDHYFSRLIQHFHLLFIPSELTSPPLSLLKFTVPLILYSSYLFPMAGKNKKAANKVSNAPKKRVGPKGNFLGLHLDYLKSVLPLYLSHHANDNGTTYTLTIQADYYTKFDWQELNTKVNPTNQIDLDHIANSSCVPDKDGSLVEKEEEWKSVIWRSSIRWVFIQFNS